MTTLPNKMMVCVCLLFLAGCVGSKKTFVAVEPSAEKGSVVYIYRPAKAANVMLAPDVSIAGIKKFAIGNGDYKQLYLPAGKHAIKLAATKGNTPSITYDLIVVEQRVHFLRVEATMKLEFGNTYQPYKRKFEVQEVLTQHAMTEIAACTDMDVQVKQKTPVAAVGGDQPEKEEATFSIDKTSNPFSR